MSTPRYVIFAAGLWATTALLSAQATPAPVPTESPSDDENVLVLTPFEVNTSRDVGYLAGSSMLGGRLNTELKDTPASISVITREFLDDLGIYNFTDAAGWTPNVVSDYELNGENQFNDYNARFRGLSTNAQSRNFFTWFVNADSYNTERLDFSRGPNSVVFGSADIGGIGNVSTKQAIQRDIRNARVITTNFGGYRAELDINLPLTKKWAIRLNGLKEDLKGWRDYEKRQRDGLHFTTKYNFTKNLSVSAEYEYGDINRTILSRGVFNGFDGWDRTTFVTAPLTSSLPSATGITRRTSDYFYYAPGSDSGMLNERTLGTTSSGAVVAQMLTVARPETGWRSDVIIPGASHAKHFFAPNTNAGNPYHTYSFFINASPLPNLFVEAAYNHQEQERLVDQLVWQAIGVDINRVRADGSPNPYAGQYYADSIARVQNQKNIIDDWRIAASYKIQTKLTDQSLLVLTGRRKNDFYLDQSEFVRVDAGRGNVIYNNSVNQVRIRRYISLLDEDWSVPTIDPSAPVQARWAKSSNRMSRGETTYYQAALSGKWFQKRNLVTTLGVRRDINGPGGRRDAVTDPVTRETATMTDFIPGTDKKGFTTKSAGLVYQFSDKISIYGGYAESFNTASEAIGLDGGPLDPEINEGLEGGIRLELAGGKLNATLAYYENERTNKRETGAATDINAIWQDLASSNSVPVGYSDVSSDYGSGYEFEVVGRPFANLDILANYSVPDSYQTKGLTATQAYYDQHIAAWQAGAAAATDLTVRDRILQNIADVEGRLASFPEGRKLRNQVKFTANILATYRFRQGTFRGLSLSLGTQLRGEKLVTSNNTSISDYWADGYTLYTAGMNYTRKIKGVTCRFQINVTNLLDKEIVRESRVENFTVNAVTSTMARNYTILDPRRIQLTTSFGF